MNYENACGFPFRLLLRGLALSMVSFSLELQILQMNSYSLNTHAHTHTPCKNHPTVGVV